VNLKNTNKKDTRGPIQGTRFKTKTMSKQSTFKLIMAKTNNTNTLGTVVPHVKPKPINAKVQVESYLASKYDIRYNVVLGKPEYKLKADSKYHPVSDVAINSLEREMLNADIPCNVSLLLRTLISDYSTAFNPFAAYFNSLPAWDGRTDHILALAQTVVTTDDKLWQFCFRKWLVAMVGCALSDKVINHTAIVFSGKQGIGKTTWILNLLPAELKDYCYTGTIDPQNKDTTINLAETILINIDELESLNKNQLGALKEIMTKSSIRLRRPFGRMNENLQRRASFSGSVNGKDFLSDTTGSRRFLCFEVTLIDYSHNVLLPAVYSQALQLFRNGFQYWFNEGEIAQINKNNEQFRNMAIEEELLSYYFEPCAEDESDYAFSATEVINWLGQKAKISLTEASKIKMGKALTAGGYLRIKRQGRYVYIMKQKVYVPDCLVNSISTKNLIDCLAG